MTGRIVHHHAEYHRPRFYRYRVGGPGFRIVRNVYPWSPPSRGDTHVGTAWIGQAIVIGRYAYCVRWAYPRLRFERSS